MKTYPEGTRWAVRWAAPSGLSGLLTQSDDQGIQRAVKHADYVEAAKAVDHSRWCETQTNPRAPYTYRLVRLTPKPRRTVEERIAEAVKAAVAAAVRERTEVILAEWQAPWSEAKRRPVEQHFAEWLRDLRDGKVSA